MPHYVYILTNKKRGVLYIGATSNLIRRTYEHRESLVEGFTKRYRIRKLVYYEIAETEPAAITRERQMKEWNRAWKIALIEGFNVDWKDLYDSLLG